MNRLDRLVLREMIGPWVFGVAIFTVIVATTTLLVRLTDWVVRGVDPGTIAQILALLTPSMVVKTFGMALLLSTLLAFGRLSNDSEVVALRAAGASLFRILRPVLLFSLAVAAAMFVVGETVIPDNARTAAAITTEVRKQLDKSKGGKPVFHTVFGKQGIAAQIMARDFSLLTGTLEGVTIVAYGVDGTPSFVLLADELVYSGPQDWRIRGRARLFSADGKWLGEIRDGAWPSQVVRPTFEPVNLLAGFTEDLDVFSFRQITEEIDKLKQDPLSNPRQIANLEFGRFNKIALPLGAMVFGLLGAPLGIRNVRTGVGTGFAMSVLLSFGYMMLANFMAVYAKSGAVPGWLASFAPVMVGAVAAAVVIARRNG